MPCKTGERAYDGTDMALRRRGLIHRFIALLIAAAMPLCCCVINAGGSCCMPVEDAPIVEVASCCASEHCQTDQADVPTEQAPCSDMDCRCCLKAPGQMTDWTPPVDTIGTDIPEYALATPSDPGRTGTWTTVAWHDPPPKPGGVDALRGLVILQV